MSNYLFSTGTARGGTNVMMKSLSVSEEAQLTNDPYLALFKYFRSAVVKKELGQDIAVNYPLEDYYYQEAHRDTVRAIYNANLDIAFNDSDREKLIEDILVRVKVSTPVVGPFLSSLKGTNFLELFRQAIDAIAKAYKSEDASWLGLNENWAIEFFPALARSFREAKFLVIIRDVRAAIFSALKQKDRTKMIQVLSFAKGWRKNIAFSQHFLADPLFKDRLMVCKYEDFVTEPKKHLQEMCDWLGVKFKEEMLDPRNYVDGNGQIWKGNSYIHDKRPPGIYPDSINSWQGKLDKKIVEVIEFVAAAELIAFGYELAEYKGGSLSAAALEFLKENSLVKSSWKSSTISLEDELEKESFRNQLVLDRGKDTSKDIIEAYFLFEAAYKRVVK